MPITYRCPPPQNTRRGRGPCFTHSASFSADPPVDENACPHTASSSTLSPAHFLTPLLPPQVREFNVEDACPYTVEFRWDRDGEMCTQALFEKNSPFPSTKSLTLLRNQPFKVAAYAPELGTKIGEFEVRDDEGGPTPATHFIWALGSVISLGEE